MRKIVLVSSLVLSSSAVPNQVNCSLRKQNMLDALENILSGQLGDSGKNLKPSWVVQARQIFAHTDTCQGEVWRSASAFAAFATSHRQCKHAKQEAIRGDQSRGHQSHHNRHRSAANTFLIERTLLDSDVSPKDPTLVIIIFYLSTSPYHRQYETFCYRIDR